MDSGLNVRSVIVLKVSKHKSSLSTMYRQADLGLEALDLRVHGHAGMQAFTAATERLLPLCDQTLEALHFRQGFQACLTCGELHPAFYICDGAKDS